MIFKNKKGEFFIVLVVFFVISLLTFVLTYPMVQQIVEPVIPSIMTISPIAGFCILFLPMWMVFWITIKIFFGGN